MQIIYGLIEDMGDGSSRIRWFRNHDIVEDIKENDEYFASNYRATVFQFPDDLNLEECGFDFCDSYFTKRDGKYKV